MEAKIKQLIKTSKKVILDCSLENGAIVAANTDHEQYPKNVANYRYVWPRDVSFTLYAASLLNIKDIQKKFLDWLLNRAEDFSDTGIIYQRYATNGARDTEFGYQYQPDQAGALLWSLLATNKKLNNQTEKVVKLLAKGLCKNWDKNHFFQSTHDLWEERYTIPQLKDNFGYTLAACSFGLGQTAQRLNKRKWLKVSQEMKQSLQNFKGNYYVRLWGQLPDKSIDASVLALIWPFQVMEINKKLLKSLELVEQKLLTPQGVKRYEHDQYDGRIANFTHWKKGAGGWPLITFWYIIALSKSGRKIEARKLFDEQINKFKNFIPEQVFDNELQISVSPLCWSHSMLVIASRELGYL
ncbi:hypothetical protein IID20_03165 [Patescibacteria group bacterium]|nr:hypothetical protein [Patescibacteria group bacterium]